MEELNVEGVFRSLRILFGSLTVKERKVLFMRQGINEQMKNSTLEEVGKELGVTRERIRQIEAKAEERIRMIIRDVSHFKVEMKSPQVIK